MRARRHHNNDGRKMIKSGSHLPRLKRLALRMGVEHNLQDVEIGGGHDSQMQDLQHVDGGQGEF